MRLTQLWKIGSTSGKQGRHKSRAEGGRGLGARGLAGSGSARACASANAVDPGQCSWCKVRGHSRNDRACSIKLLGTKITPSQWLMFANQKTVPLPFEDEAVVVGVPQNTNWVQVLSLFSTTAGATLLSCKFYKNANEQLGAGLVQLLALARWSDSGRLRHSVVVQAHPPRPAAAEGGGGAATTQYCVNAAATQYCVI